MQKTDGRKNEWVKHSRNSQRGKRGVNKLVRATVKKLLIKKPDLVKKPGVSFNT